MPTMKSLTMFLKMLVQDSAVAITFLSFLNTSG